MKVQELEQLQVDITAAKEKKARDEGALQVTMNTLAKTHKCKTIEKAKIKYKKLREQEKEVNDQLGAKLDEIEELYE